MPSLRAPFLAGLTLAGPGARLGAQSSADAPVGFRVTGLVDPSRPTPSSPRGRPLQLGIWYPAESGSTGVAARYRTYVALEAGERGGMIDSASAARATAGFAAFVTSTGLSDSVATALLDAPMRAVSGAAPRRRRSPVVLLAPGNGGSIAALAFLGEALAAHGYVAVAVPSPTRLGDSLTSEAGIGAVARAQAADLAFALAAVRREPGLQTGAAGIAGHSLGARGALLFAMAEPAVRAVVSLDGGIGTATGSESMLAEIGPGRRLRTPLLHIYERRDAYMAPDFRFLRTVAPGARVHVAESPALHHVHFSSFGDLAAALPALGARTGAPATMPSDLAQVRRTVLRFLDRELGNRGPSIVGDGLTLEPLPAPDPRADLLAADHARARAAAALPLPEALALALADDGLFVVSRGDFVRGAAAVRRQVAADSLDAASRAEWTPMGGDVSSDGLDGFTYGYVTVTRTTGERVPGKYLAYWRRGRGGWKMLALKRGRRPDGPEAAPPAEWSRDTRAPSPAGGKRRTALDTIFAIDRRFSAAAQTGAEAAFLAHAEERAVAFGNDASFAWGGAAAAAGFREFAPGTVSWVPLEGAVAASGDLAVVTGEVTFRSRGADGTLTVDGVAKYLTIWRRQPDGSWRFAADG